MKTADINEHFVTVKTADLRGLALDWAVAKALNEPVKLVNFIGRMCLVSSNDFFDSLHLLPPTFSPSTDRAMAMTIVERFGIDLQCNHSAYADEISDLSGAALNYAVAKAIGYAVGVWADDKSAVVCRLPDGRIKFIKGGGGIPTLEHGTFHPGSDWEVAGPIIDRFKISIVEIDGQNYAGRASKAVNAPFPTSSATSVDLTSYQCGASSTEAAMRYVVSEKFGKSFDIPGDLEFILF